jgi:hypothetical protein
MVLFYSIPKPYDPAQHLNNYDFENYIFTKKAIKYNIENP